MAKQFAVQDFFKRFPDDETCLDHLMQVRYGFELDCPKCGKHGKFTRVRKIPAYQCAWCGHHIHPMAGTPFASSRTPLQKWFYAMYLFTVSRHGVPAKELQRQLSVTYKCAWRIGHEIRKYLGTVDGNPPLDGEIEMDETFMGGYKPDSYGGRGKAMVFAGCHLFLKARIGLYCANGMISQPKEKARQQKKKTTTIPTAPLYGIPVVYHFFSGLVKSKVFVNLEPKCK